MAIAKHDLADIQLKKTQTGIQGLDEITNGGLPLGRPTLVCGAAGCGKTLFAMEFVVRGALQFNEPGVIISFEEKPEELTQNFASFGYNLNELMERNLLIIDHIPVEPSEIEEAGEYDLSGLFIRLAHAIEQINAKRVVLDTLEALFAGLQNAALLRAELRRLFQWLKSQGVTAVITAERGEGTLTRYGIEEYVADCVILLDHRVSDQKSTRRLRVVKYRGSMHGTNEYPFLISEQGVSVLPVTSLGLNHSASTERISSGVPQMDAMLGGKGYYRGSSVLVTGTAGTGKTSIAVQFALSACRHNERCLYFAFEESQSQIMRNMRSIGVELQPCVEQGLLHFHAVRPTKYGLEMHLVILHDLINRIKPSVVVFDPLTNLAAVGNTLEVKEMLTRLIDHLKASQITALFTSLTTGGSELESTDVGISSLMDTWLLLRMVELNGERKRLLYILKARGMAHSNHMHEFILTDEGVQVQDVVERRGELLSERVRPSPEDMAAR